MPYGEAIQCGFPAPAIPNLTPTGAATAIGTKKADSQKAQRRVWVWFGCGLINPLRVVMLLEYQIQNPKRAPNIQILKVIYFNISTIL